MSRWSEAQEKIWMSSQLLEAAQRRLIQAEGSVGQSWVGRAKPSPSLTVSSVLVKVPRGNAAGAGGAAKSRR